MTGRGKEALLMNSRTEKVYFDFRKTAEKRDNLHK